jgi:hypothetical protein
MPCYHFSFNLRISDAGWLPDACQPRPCALRSPKQ